jgi:tricarballylate dehydrogenase
VNHENPKFDVLIVGGGHAGLTAAICAAEEGASVGVLEAAPFSHRAGNSRHTRNLRPMHTGPVSVMTGSYEEAEYWDDLLRVTEGETDEKLARMMIRQSAENVEWLQNRGVQFQPPLTGTLHLGRTNAFFMGGGKALMNALYREAARLGIRVHYDARVTDLDFDNGLLNSVVVGDGQNQCRIHAASLVAAAGGFQANLEWLKEAWGDAVDNFLIRGTPYNNGGLLKLLLERGARSVGDPRQCHAVAIDSRAPKFDGGIVTRVDCVSLGVVVNNNARRFYDEGEDYWPKRYAIWGRLVAEQPDQIAHVIIDAKARGGFIPPAYPPETANTIAELARKIGLESGTLERTINEYNQAVKPGEFDHGELDNCFTEGMEINKTHWARTIDTPPFSAYSLRPGITFTYLGVGVDEHAQVQMADGSLSRNVFAAGEIMAGNVLGKGYLAGIGMTIGSVFGRIAGTHAAKYTATNATSNAHN